MCFYIMKIILTKNYLNKKSSSKSYTFIERSDSLEQLNYNIKKYFFQVLFLRFKKRRINFLPS
mgnify:CR=1 FL=1